MVTPVICLAHGSRHPEADAAVARIADAVSGLTGAPAHPSYLDFSALTLTTVAHLLAAEGHRRATVVPLLFTRAFHMRHDVPEALAEASAATGLEFTLADGIGTGGDVAALLASRIPPGTGHLVLYSVGSSVPGADETVAGLAADVGRRAEVSAELVTATGPSGGVDALVDAPPARCTSHRCSSPRGPCGTPPSTFSPHCPTTSPSPPASPWTSLSPH